MKLDAITFELLTQSNITKVRQIQLYDEFGIRSIALGVHKNNFGAERFYLNHGFRKTEVLEGNDYYYLRYPNGTRLHFEEA